MSVTILLNESNASRRVVPLPPLVQSNGTSSCTNESGRTFFFSVGGIDYGSGGSISAISAGAGLYECLFSASKVSVMGPGRVYYSSGTALPASTAIEVVPFNSYDSMRQGLFALPNAAAEASGGLITFGTSTGQLHVSSGSVGLKAQTHSQATVTGINNILAGTYSGVTLGVDNIKPASYSGVSVGALDIKPASYSGVTVGINNILAGTYSGVTVQGVTRVNSSVTPANATYSAITVRLDSYDYSSLVTVGVGNIKGASYSDVTIQGVSNTSTAAALVSDITGGVWYAGSRSGVTIDGAKFLSVAGERSLASSYLSTNLGNTRYVQEAYFVLRNKVNISGSTMTVYLTDDSTSAFTATVSTGTATIYGIDPTG